LRRNLRLVFDEPGAALIALIGATLAAILTAVVGFFLYLPIALVLRWMHLLSDEGAAWSGISLGPPIAAICAFIAFVYSFKKLVG
jgi:hypothetical protein